MNYIPPKGVNESFSNRGELFAIYLYDAFFSIYKCELIGLLIKDFNPSECKYLPKKERDDYIKKHVSEKQLNVFVDALYQLLVPESSSYPIFSVRICGYIKKRGGLLVPAYFFLIGMSNLIVVFLAHQNDGPVEVHRYFDLFLLDNQTLSRLVESRELEIFDS